MGRPPGLLLVEGRDDREFIFQACNRAQLDNRALFDTVAMREARSGDADQRVQESSHRLREEVRAFRYERVGLLVDADLDAARV